MGENGGENTRFFHTYATKSYRCNFIAMLNTEDNRMVCDHDDKAVVLWHAFKQRIGCSDNPTMAFDLSNLIVPNPGIDFPQSRGSFHQRGD